MDLTLAILFIGTPVAIWVVSRSVTYTAATTIIGFGILGNAVQTTASWGVSWNVRGLQLLAASALLASLMGAVLLRRVRRGSAGSLHAQLIGVGIPILILGLLLLVSRLVAPDDPGTLSGLGYLVSHQLGEDNAKFLHLAAQLADGREVEFNGYAAGPLLLLMSMVAAVMATLSTFFFGGVNEVAVVLNTVIGGQHLMMMLTPIALAPLVEFRALRNGRSLAMPLIWTSMLVLFLASALLTEYGHMSLQFVLIILVLWACVFSVASPWWAKLSLTLAIATSASVWIPLNVLGLILVVAAIVWSARRKHWWGLGLSIAVLAMGADALVSSISFMIGFPIDVRAIVSGSSDQGAASSIADSSASAVSEVLEKSTAIFTIGGGTESASALLVVLALVSVIGAAIVLSKELSTDNSELVYRFAPMLIFGAYVVALTAADSVAAGGGAHYGSLKIGFALVIMAAASYLPFALSGLSFEARGMTGLRWIGVAAVVLLLTWDSFLPRALSAISPSRWQGVDADSPIYWAAAEVKPMANQPLSSLPVACVIAPPHTPRPTALPWGQETYSCTRLLLGMNGLEGKTSFTNNWLGTEWVQQKSIWDDVHDRMPEWTAAIADRQVIVMNKDAQLAGFTTFTDLIRMNPPRVN